jgi:enoyl-CoA hydratase
MFGYCLGGGLEVPLGCHFRLAADEGAQIGLPELDLGAVPAWGGSARLAKCVGENQAMDMILRSKKISGKKALEIGLVHEIWPLEELKSAAVSLAHELASQPAQAVKSMMSVLVNSSDRELEDLLKAERQAVLDNSGTKDSQEGMIAFLEKRKPEFNK